MDKNEVITLSSDEESDFTHRLESSRPSNKLGLKDSTGSLKPCNKNIITCKNKRFIILSKKPEIQILGIPKVPEKKLPIISKETPEIVDLESSEKSVADEQVHLPCTNNESSKIDVNHSNLDIIDLDAAPSPNITTNNTDNNSINKPDDTNKDVFEWNKVRNSLQTEPNKQIISEGSDQNLMFFTEFVEHCGCLEEIPSDRARLTKKLMKRYGEADYSYTKSQEFRNVVQKCRDKVNKNNLYLIAKEITDELNYRKKIEINTGKSNLVEETCQRDQESTVTVKVQDGDNKKSKKRTKVINKVIKKLDKLGSKIRELEEQEVDLSDEEDSSYIQLQRYRDRFCQIYTKLCNYTNEMADADRIYNRKICFTESKYPNINKCIENWLNKTRRFPDFSDIMKLLESQSVSLGLPSNRESIRLIAIEIFQKVGMMLQRRRKYDLWDTFCGFLDEGEDPASKDPLLDRVLKSNYEVRIKKEQEIFTHFAELQEKERLEPEEVPDEEANRSPVESGNEDDKEIEDIENSLNKKLDVVIKKETEENANSLENSTCDAVKNNSLESLKDEDQAAIKSKESKNNFRNCKSLKWKLENGTKAKRDDINSEGSVTGLETEKETQKKPENGVGVIMDEVESKMEEVEKMTSVKDTKSEKCNEVKMDATSCFDSPLKRKWQSEDEDVILKKTKYNDKENAEKELDLFEVIDESEISGKETSEVFEIRCCQIVAENAFEDINGKENDWGKRKVFRDLTNVGRLMGLHGRKKKTSGLFFPPSVFHRSFYEFEKPSWKKRFKVSFKLVGSKSEKCALNQEEKSGKRVKPDSDGGEKNIQNNSAGTGDDDDKDKCNSGRGNGGEGDNNEDENKKNGRRGDELNENQHEEDEEEEEENETEVEEDNNANSESVEHSFLSVKTEEPSDRNEDFHSEVEKVRAEEGDQQPLPTETLETEVSFEREIEKRDKGETGTSESDLNSALEKENLIANEYQENEITEEREKGTPETEKEESEAPSTTETNEFKLSEPSESERSAVDSKLVEDSEIQKENCSTEDSKHDQKSVGETNGWKTKNEEEAMEVETQDKISKAEEETADVESKDRITNNEEETADVERKERITSNEEETSDVERRDRITNNQEETMEVEAEGSITKEETKDVESNEEEGKEVAMKGSASKYEEEEAVEVESKECVTKGEDMEAETEDKITKEETKDIGSKEEEIKQVESKDSITKGEEEAVEIETKNRLRKGEEGMEVEIEDRTTKEETKDIGSKEEEIKQVESKDSITKGEEVVEIETKNRVRKGEDMEAETEDRITKEENKDVESNEEEIKQVESKDSITNVEGDMEAEDRITNDEEAMEVKELPKESNTNEVGTPKKADVRAPSRSSNQDIADVQFVNKQTEPETRQRSRGRLRNRTTFIANENETVRAKRKAREIAERKLTLISKPIQVDPPVPKLSRRNTPSTSDEEIVKRFLLHSPSSISITPPRKMSLSKPPSQAAMQALATLRNLKGISATIVRGSKPKNEDDVVVIGGSYRRRAEQNSNPVKRRRNDLPVISNVQSVDTTTPKIVTVQGNVSGFENAWPEISNDFQCNSSSIRISNVWGSLPNTFMPSGQNSESPGCSSRQNNPGSSNSVRKKNAKKTVEYVVLE